MLPNRDLVMISSLVASWLTLIICTGRKGGLDDGALQLVQGVATESMVYSLA